MSILSGYGKFKRYLLTNEGYKLCSQWTSSNTVHFDDNKTAQTKLGAIDGITDSLTATSSNVALSANAGKSLQDQITELNTGISYWIDNGYLPIPGSFVPVNILSLSVADFSRVSLTAASSNLSKSGGNFVLQTTYSESNSKNGAWESIYLNIGKATTFQYAVNQTFSNPTGCGITFYLVEEGTDAVEQLIYVSTTNGTGTINLNLKSTKKYKLRIEHISRNGTTTTTITKLSFS